jgi:NTP pyrophosphatase (non-canonical NTP hydrolase)
MSDINTLMQALVEFRDERDWNQFHDSKNLAIALSIEAAELNELFLWKDVKESEQVDIQRIKEELADVFAYALLLAEKHQLNVSEIVLDKILRNGEKYPVEKSKGNAQKYTEL